MRRLDPSSHDAEVVSPAGENASPASVLAHYPELAKIADPIWLAAINGATHYRFTAGTVLLCGRMPFRQLLLLLEGSMRVYQSAPDGRELTLYRMEPGDPCLLSLNGLLQDQDLQVSAQSITDAHAIGIAEGPFYAALAGSQAFRAYVLSALNSRLCELMRLVQDTAFQNLSVRLACLLGQLFERARSNTIRVTHQGLAQELGTTREAVSRLLKELEQRACIHLARGRIELVGESSVLLKGRNRR